MGGTIHCKTDDTGSGALVRAPCRGFAGRRGLGRGRLYHGEAAEGEPGRYQVEKLGETVRFWTRAGFNQQEAAGGLNEDVQLQHHTELHEVFAGVAEV